MEVFLFPSALTLGAKIRMARVGRHWRQVDLAEQAGVPQTTVSALERGLNIYQAAEKKILQSVGLIADGVEHYQKLIAAYQNTTQLRDYFQKRLEYLQDGQGFEIGGSHRYSN